MQQEQTEIRCNQNQQVTFPPVLDDVYERIWNEVIELHIDWDQYNRLFQYSKERIDLLRWAAKPFFAFLQDTLHVHIMLVIGQLTDPSRSCRWDNASLCYLLDKLTPHLNDDELVGELQTKWDSLRQDCNAVREHRHRYIAHADLATAVAQNTDPRRDETPEKAVVPNRDPLPDVTLDDIGKCIAKIAAFFDAVGKPFGKTATSWDSTAHLPTVTCGVDLLIARLERARECEQTNDKAIAK